LSYGREWVMGDPAAMALAISIPAICDTTDGPTAIW
jgi:hypothetical protein